MHDVPATLRIDLARHAMQRARHERIVRVEKAKDVAGGGPKALVDGIGLTAVRLANHSQMVVTRQNLRRAIGRHAVDDDVLEVRVVLRQHALDGASDERRLIE